MRHWNVGAYQVLWWPRWTVAFYRGPSWFPSYRWIVYVWPIEVRRWIGPPMRDSREAWTTWIKGRTPSGVKVNTRPSTNKYQAHSVRVDGILFDSQREADRYQELKLMAAAGVISSIEIHPGFPLIVKELYRVDGPEILHTVGMYHADFKYRDHRTASWVVEDVKAKPTKTEAYQLRKKIVEKIHGITITEIA